MNPFITHIDLLLEYIKSEDYLKSDKTSPNRINFADFKKYLEKRDDVDSNNMILEFDYDNQELRKISRLVFKNVELKNITISGFGEIEGNHSIRIEGNFKIDSFIVKKSNINLHIYKEDVGNNQYKFENCEFRKIELTSLENEKENQSNYALSFLECKIDKFSTVGYKYFANRINFKNCEFKEISLTNKIFNSTIGFYECQFNGIVIFNDSEFNKEAFFNDSKFNKEASFTNSKFNGIVSFNDSEFNNETIFNNSKFNNEASFTTSKFNGIANFTNSKFDKKAVFNNSKFNRVDFSNSKFNNITFFNKSKFNRVDFTNSKFNHEVFFNNSAFNNEVIFNNSEFNDNVSFVDSIFDSYSYFKACKFEQIANFNDVVFNKFPDFSTCFFKEPRAVNFINVDISIIDFESIEKYINENIKEDKQYKVNIRFENNDSKLKIKCVRIIRDSSRVIKDILISQNNPIDAQTWHKLELYARENELKLESEYNEEKNKVENSKEKDEPKDNPKLESKCKKSNILSIHVDKLLLCIYRITSDHHTNFLKILNFTILVISINAVFLCVLKYFIENFIIHEVLATLAIIALALLLLYIAGKLALTTNLLTKAPSYCVFISVILFSPSLILPFTGIFSINVDKNQVLTKYLNNMDNQDLINIIKKSDIKDLDTKLLEAKHIELTKTITQNKDKISQKINKELQRVLFKSKAYDRAKEIANLIYTIILLLCIYSLQKTARKNSLIPS